MSEDGRGIRTLPLCAPRFYPPIRWVGGRTCLSSGELAIAPAWLLSGGDQPSVDWALARPAPFAYAHLVNMWRCFGTDSCYGRANRLWWLRSAGMWDLRIDAAGLTPGGPAWGNDTRVLVVGAAALRNVGSYLDLRRLLHDLVVAAALLGRRPVIPQIECSTFLRTSSGEKDGYRYGVALPEFAAVGAFPGMCRPFPGGSECSSAEVMHHFDFERFERSSAAGQPPPREGSASSEASSVPTKAHSARTRGRLTQLPTRSPTQADPGRPNLSHRRPVLQLRQLETLEAEGRAAALCNLAAYGNARWAVPVAVLADAGQMDTLLLQRTNLTDVLVGRSLDPLGMLPPSHLIAKACPGYGRRLRRLQQTCGGYLLDSEKSLDRALTFTPKQPQARLRARQTHLEQVGGDSGPLLGEAAASYGSGFCQATEEGKPGDCSVGTMGSWGLGARHTISWKVASQVCMHRCLACNRCRFVSVSLTQKDCSWYASCDTLQTSVPGFHSYTRGTPPR